MANRLYNKQVTPKGYKMGGRVKKMGGGSLKAVPAGNKGLKKLPTKVRNKMGFMEKGGRVGFSSGSKKKETRAEKKKRKRKELSQQVSKETLRESMKDVMDTKGKVHSIRRGQEDAAKRIVNLIKKQKYFFSEKDLKKNFGDVRDKGYGGKHKKPEHN